VTVPATSRSARAGQSANLVESASSSDSLQLAVALFRRNGSGFRDGTGGVMTRKSPASGQSGKKVIVARAVAACRGFDLQKSRSAKAGRSATLVESAS